MRQSIEKLTAFPWFRTALIAFAACAVLAFAPSANAQRGIEHPIPTPRYYNGARYLESGDFTAAANFYRMELKSAFNIGGKFWIDSICYYAMIGESLYQAGDLNEALVNYNAALTIAMEYPNWIGRVNYAVGVTTVPTPAAPWGPSRRDVPLGVFPDKATIVIGDKITEDRIKQGGMITEQKAIPIDPIEILRCTALCIRRRTEILGPLAPFDPMSQQILDTFQKRAVAPNHWSIAWLDVIWGLALSESDKVTSAANNLANSLVMAGTYDHTLTGQALLELGNLYLRQDKVREAAACYYESSIAAYHYGDNLLVEEAIRNYSNASKALGRTGRDPVVNLAFRWSKTLKNAQTLTSSFGLELVEEFIYEGKLNLATSGLGAIDKTMRATVGRGLRTSRAADRWNYLNALLFYANGEIGEGDLALAKVVDGCKLRSPWALQLMRLDNYVKNGLSSNGALTPRNAADLYEYLLREPTVVDWAVRPTESLSIQMIAPPEAYERWFCILIDRDLKEKAFEVAERVRRERFFRTQTYGGRLLSLRYILTADDALTTASIRNARQTLYFEYPDFEETVQESKALMNELNSLPTVPTDAALKPRQVSLFERLAVTSGRQEALMRFIAAGRVRIPYVFPPVYSVDEVQQRLPADTAVLSFIDAEGETFGFMIGKDNLDAWRIGSSRRVAGAVGTFLRTIGNVDGTRQIAAADLAGAHWKAQGAKLREIVLGAQDVDADRFNIMFSKLVVVPDGALWYLPFEALCLPAIASTVEEAPEDDAIEEGDVKTGVLKSSDEANAGVEEDAEETSEEAKESEKDSQEESAEDEDEDDLDSAYVADDQEAAELEQDAEAQDESNSDEEEPSEEEPNGDGAEDSDAVEVGETPVEEAVPVKRKSKSAREREALEEYESGLIPMIQASELTIRYSATVGLSLPNALGRNAFVETTVAAGSTYPKEPPERVEAAVDRFASAVSKTEAFRVGAIGVPGAFYAARLKRLVVFDEIVGNTWNWEPVLSNKSRAGNRVADWIAAPWGAPRLFVAPALRTPAEESLKNGGNGSELFLAILAMQASGGDAMLLSRWRTGGRSAYDVATDFVKNYESQPTPDAWKRAALKLMTRDVVVEEEPRLRKLGRSESIPKYDSPFWWAGYMVIDSGEAVQLEELEKFDQANVQKAEEENALLKDEEEAGQGQGGQADASTKPNKKAQKNANENANENADSDPNDSDPAASENGEASEEAGGDDEEGVVVPSFVNKKVPKTDAGQKDGAENETDDESGADTFDLGPKTLDDDDLAAQDEDGDDFFATDDEEEGEKSDDEPKSEPEESTDDPKDASEDDEEENGLATDDEGSEPDSKADEKAQPKAAEPKASAPKAAPSKDDAKAAPKANDAKPAAKEAPKKIEAKDPPKTAPATGTQGASGAKSTGKTGRLTLKPKK